MAEPAVFDTNVLISALLWRGAPYRAVLLAQAKIVQDDKFIECAVVARARWIVSGDQHLLTLNEYQGIRILKAEDFLTEIAGKKET